MISRMIISETKLTFIETFVLIQKIVKSLCQRLKVFNILATLPGVVGDKNNDFVLLFFQKRIKSLLSFWDFLSIFPAIDVKKLFK